MKEWSNAKGAGTNTFLSGLAKRIFDEDAQNPISNTINKWAIKKAGLVKWEFNEVGSLSSCETKNKGLELFWQTCIGEGA